MNSLSEKKLNRLLTGTMALMVLVVMLFSAYFVVTHADHDCCGEDCPVCACLQQCEKLIHGTDGSIHLSVAGVLPVILLMGSALISYCVFFSDTPVSTKVRMNN